MHSGTSCAQPVPTCVAGRAPSNHPLAPTPGHPASQLYVHILLMAYGMVIVNAAALAAFILFVLGFGGRGWDWIHGALLAAMLAPTDAVAVTAILKTGGGPEDMVGAGGWPAGRPAYSMHGSLPHPGVAYLPACAALDRHHRPTCPPAAGGADGGRGAAERCLGRHALHR